MYFHVQIVDTMQPNARIDYVAWGADPSWDLIWMVVPTTPGAGKPQVEWNVAVERADNAHVTYHVTISNLTSAPLGVEGRFAILNI
jgi:hypothetical protein